MSKATLSILGMYQYDDTIFDGFNVPEGMNKDIAVNNILFNCAELEILYTEIDTLQMAITSWSSIELPKWERAFKALSLEYNPIHNYDRQEEWSTTLKGNSTSNIQGEETQTGTTESENKQTAYNSGSLVTSDTNTVTPNLTNETTTSNSTNIDNTEIRTGHASGNIGVTTSQQMLEAELQIAQKSIYDTILNSFKNNFCLLIY